MQLGIKRNTATVASVEIDDKTIFSKKLMGEHKITAEFYSKSPLNLLLGDYIEWNGEVFTMNRTPKETKENANTYHYKIDFEGQVYELYRKLLMHNGLADFHYTGTASDFLNLLITNINTVSSGWSVGTVDTTNEETIYFESHNCRTALTKIAETFSLEFALSGKQISLKKTIGTVKPYTFEYGRGKGLYSLERKQVDSQNVVTRVYGFGSTENIPYDYRDRAKRLIFDNLGKPYLEKNVSLYGIIEAQFTDDTIKPQRTGTVTGVGIDFGDLNQIPLVPANFYIEDSTLDFDLKDHLLDGKQAKIVFKSGDLSGYEFDIRSNYDHTNRRIYFKQFSDADGYVLPYEEGAVQIFPKVGDTYTLVNIKMPQTYVDAAELELKTKTQAYLDQNSTPMVIYGFDADPRYIKANGISLDVGDMVTIKDTAMGIDDLIRNTEIKYPLVEPYRIKATIADFVPYTVQERAVKTAIQAKKETYTVYKKNAELARMNTARLNELANYLLDQDGEFTAPINPISVKTLLLTVGATASNFRLDGAIFEDNYGGDVNAFRASACDLIHLEAETDSGGYTWAIPTAQTFSGLTGTEAYYLYAKCSTTALTGSWILTTEVKPSNPGDGFFYFGCGVLLPVDSKTSIRGFLTIYGKTYINGRTITTGKIQRIDGLTYFDLDADEIGGVIKFRNTLGNLQDINDIDANFVGADIAGTAAAAAASAESSANSFSNGLFNNLNSIKQDAVVNGQTLIAGGYLRNSFIQTSALYISSGNVTGLGALALEDSLNAGDVGADPAGTAYGYYTSLNAAKQDAVVNGQTLIVGGYIRSNFIDTDNIHAVGNVIAGSFNLGSGNFVVDTNGYMTAVGATIKTNASGERIEINPQNDIAIYDSANNQRVLIGVSGAGGWGEFKDGSNWVRILPSVSSFYVGGKYMLQVNSSAVSTKELKTQGKVNMYSLPTSDSGLISGDLWRSGTDLRIK